MTYEKVTIERIPFNNEETGIKKSPDQNRLGGSDIDEKPVSSQTQSLPDQNQGLGGSDIEKPVSSRTQISIPLKREVPVSNQESIYSRRSSNKKKARKGNQNNYFRCDK